MLKQVIYLDFPLRENLLKCLGAAARSANAEKR